MDLELPGFRFHPTEQELLDFYLKNMVFGKQLRYYDDIIGFLNIYRHDPWDLPGLAKIGDREWYFFVERDRQHGNGGGRPNRTTEHGFWKATGSDRKIFSSSDPKRVIGLKKTLVFYRGRAPRGFKTDWVMNEYRLPPPPPPTFSSSPKDIVLCKIYRKAISLKVLEQRAAMEEATTTNKYHSPPPPPPPPDTISFSSQPDELTETISESLVVLKTEEDQQVRALIREQPAKEKEENSSSLRIPTGNGIMDELQVPKFTMDWTQDPIWTQLHSPWLDHYLLCNVNLPTN